MAGSDLLRRLDHFQKHHGVAGIGFVFAKGGRIFGIDIDKCRNPETGELDERATEIVHRFPTYAEISPSGTGVHIFGRGELPSDRGRNNRELGIEAYESGRFFCVTGHAVNGNPCKVLPCNGDDVNEWFRSVFPERPKPPENRGPVTPSSLSDQEIVRRAGEAKNGDKFRSLWSGEWKSLGYKSQSEADRALCRMLAFWTGPDESRIALLFRSSGLYREKWDRDDYRASTIGSALEGQTEFFGSRKTAYVDIEFDAGNSTANATSQPASGQSIANFTLIDVRDINGDIKKDRKPLSMASILAAISTATKGWPRRVGSSLFYHGRCVDWLASPAATFGFIGHAAGLPVTFCKNEGYHTKDEVFHELRRTATAYHAVETLPHEPPIAEHYYACEAPATGDGTALKGLVDRFSPETDIDEDLIVAMFATVLWGGPGGTRPAFLITADEGRGSGKSKTAAMVCQLAGHIELSANEDATVIKQRLLSPDGITRRVVLLDNVKSMKFSWAELEALITAPIVSGKAMYVGESQRPNMLTWIITLNGASLSTDMAQRCVVIKLKRPTYSATWEEDTRAYITAHRPEIIADLIAFLRKPPATLDRYSRWGAWERGVLSRLPEPADAQRVIAERQCIADFEREESEIVEEFFREQLLKFSSDTEARRIFIPSATAAQWWSWATGERGKSVIVIGRMLKSAIEQGKFKQLAICPSRKGGRGLLWIGSQADPNESPDTDLESRISEYMKRKNAPHIDGNCFEDRPASSDDARTSEDG